ncbi:x-prolyl-dipeptidyl aminopeptidase [Gemmatimonas phototrophica]|uniref:Xaa-Pro dipeptidyl-peptidase n=1 Tax=Gemmatimonas phototrophica TaxID=1379270 RepID=A0A143BPU1_9BACT|nr:x-prolyl-dipeptidyl aminopeptidase [Gemmatimonas phototrophica]
MFSACRPAQTPGSGTVAAAAVPALYVIADGQSQVVPAFADTTAWIRERLWVETEFDSDYDGKRDRVHVDVTRPGPTATGLKVPVVYETSPYFAGTDPDDGIFWPVKQELGDSAPTRKLGKGATFNPNRTRISNSQIRNWVPRGFAVVHSESPGTGLSQGCVTIGGMNESLAPKAVIDWLNGRAKGFTTIDGTTEVKAAWATGKVGMTGTSFNGTLPVAVATTGVKGLEAIIPVSPNNSYYRYYRSNGLVRSPGGYLGEDVDVLYDYVQSGKTDTRALCHQKVRADIIWKGLDRRTGDLSDFWTKRDYIEQAKGIRAAMLTAHGFNDWNVMPSHTTIMADAVRANGVPVQMYFHQGGHGGEPPLGMMNRWFTRYLLGVQNGVEQDPRSFVVREGASRQSPTAYAAYPHPESQPVALFPLKGGGQVGTLGFDKRTGQGTESLTDDVNQSGAQLALATSSAHRLLYATPELKAPVHLSGTARISIRVASSKAAANLSVWLVELPWPANTRGAMDPNGIITRGWADPQNAKSLRTSEPLVPGQPVTVTFDLEPDDQIVPAGKRIGLMIFSSDKDFTLWPAPGTVLTVDLDGTSLVLPVVGGSAALMRALP